jgi:hypothetical protein
MTLEPHILSISRDALDAHATIFSGQLFRFHLTDASTIIGVQGENVVQLEQRPNAIHTFTSHAAPKNTSARFSTSIPLTSQR